MTRVPREYKEHDVAPWERGPNRNRVMGSCCGNGPPTVKDAIRFSPFNHLPQKKHCEVGDEHFVQVSGGRSIHAGHWIQS